MLRDVVFDEPIRSRTMRSEPHPEAYVTRVDNDHIPLQAPFPPHRHVEIDHMDDINTYWGGMITLTQLMASPSYESIAIPVNPRQQEQWRINSTGRRNTRNPRSTAVFLLRAVHPIPTRYISHMSTPQLEYLLTYLSEEHWNVARRFERDIVELAEWDALESVLETYERIRDVIQQRDLEGLQLGAVSGVEHRRPGSGPNPVHGEHGDSARRTSLHEETRTWSRHQSRPVYEHATFDRSRDISSVTTEERWNTSPIPPSTIVCGRSTYPRRGRTRLARTPSPRSRPSRRAAPAAISQSSPSRHPISPPDPYFYPGEIVLSPSTSSWVYEALDLRTPSPVALTRSRRANHPREPFRERYIGTREWGDTPPSSLSMGTVVHSRPARQQGVPHLSRAFPGRPWYDDTFRRDVPLATRRSHGPMTDSAPSIRSISPSTPPSSHARRVSQPPRSHPGFQSPVLVHPEQNGTHPTTNEVSHPSLPILQPASLTAASHSNQPNSHPTVQHPPPSPAPRSTNQHNGETRPSPPLQNGTAHNTINGNGIYLTNPMPSRQVPPTTTPRLDAANRPSPQAPRHPLSFYQRVSRNATVEDAVDDDDVGEGHSGISISPVGGVGAGRAQGEGNGGRREDGINGNGREVNRANGGVDGEGREGGGFDFSLDGWGGR